MLLQDSGTQIRADAITLNEKIGTLTGHGQRRDDVAHCGTKDGGAKGTSTRRGPGEFQFDDAKRRAVFIKQAQLDGVQGNLRADRIELVLAPTDNTLERLEGDGAVTVAGREARGHRTDDLTYHPADEQYVLVGTPVRLVQGCREINRPHFDLLPSVR